MALQKLDPNATSVQAGAHYIEVRCTNAAVQAAAAKIANGWVLLGGDVWGRGIAAAEKLAPLAGQSVHFPRSNYYDPKTGKELPLTQGGKFRARKGYDAARKVFWFWVEFR